MVQSASRAPGGVDCSALLEAHVPATPMKLVRRHRPVLLESVQYPHQHLDVHRTVTI